MRDDAPSVRRVESASNRLARVYAQRQALVTPVDRHARRLVPVRDLRTEMTNSWQQAQRVDVEFDFPLAQGEGEIEFDIDALGLLPGICHLSAKIAHRDQPSGMAIDWRHHCLTLRVDPGKSVRGTFYARTDGASFARTPAWRATRWKSARDLFS